MWVHRSSDRWPNGPSQGDQRISIKRIRSSDINHGTYFCFHILFYVTTLQRSQQTWGGDIARGEQNNHLLKTRVSNAQPLYAAGEKAWTAINKNRKISRATNTEIKHTRSTWWARKISASHIVARQVGHRAHYCHFVEDKRCRELTLPAEAVTEQTRLLIQNLPPRNITLVVVDLNDGFIAMPMLWAAAEMLDEESQDQLGNLSMTAWWDTAIAKLQSARRWIK